jgi:hypothetical protein
MVHAVRDTAQHTRLAALYSLVLADVRSFGIWNPSRDGEEDIGLNISAPTDDHRLHGKMTPFLGLDFVHSLLAQPRALVHDSVQLNNNSDFILRHAVRQHVATLDAVDPGTVMTRICDATRARRQHVGWGRRGERRLLGFASSPQHLVDEVQRCFGYE